MTTRNTELDINEIIDIVFKKHEKRLNDLTNRTLIQMHKYFNIRTKFKNKYSLIKQLAPIEKRYHRINELEESNYNQECPICFETIKKDEYIITNCLHIFCQKCIVRHIIIGNNETCPCCRQLCKADDLLVLPIENELLEEFGILKINQTILDTGLFILETIRFRQYITNSNIISLIKEYQERHMYRNKLLLVIKFCLVIYGILFLSII
jgi:hypothetical protein